MARWPLVELAPDIESHEPAVHRRRRQNQQHHHPGAADAVRIENGFLIEPDADSLATVLLRQGVRSHPLYTRFPARYDLLRAELEEKRLRLWSCSISQGSRSNTARAGEPVNSYDVVIVGGGPTGLACAIEAKRRGLTHLVLEKGCVVNSILHYPVNMVFFTTPELLEIGDIPMVSQREKPTRVEALKYYRLVAQRLQLNIHQYERVVKICGADGRFELLTRTRTGDPSCYTSRKVVLATGYYDIPNLLGIPGEDLPKVSHYYTEAHPYYDCDVAVIGGANSAAEAALELFRSGARVTLIHREPTLSHRIKYWVRPDIENRIKNGQIKALFETEVVEIRPDSILVAPVNASGGQVETLPNDFVFALTGYRPDEEFLQSAGVRLEPVRRRPECNPKTLESNVPGLYLAGVIVAGLDSHEVFIENGRLHGKLVLAAIAEKLGRNDQ
ncbi:MAG: YpdA family putative bacillithiol disulfide reductase [Acidobacteria bacterium]|nr:YpdA family putative bacillithiol disulfide reductase [Acidobacteriota bacterium]